MIFFRSFILLAVTLLCTFCSGAQDNKYVYRDTAILGVDSVAANVVEIAPVENGEDEIHDVHAGDTILRNNQLTVESDSVRVIKNLKAFAYAKNLDSMLHIYQQNLETAQAPEKNEISWIDRLFLSPITKYFFWILAGIFVFLILYNLFFTEGFFQRSSAKTKVIMLPDETENLSKDTDYAKLIARAVINSNYRLAVRYHYLQSLQKLSSKAAIQFAAHKTNNQYINELSGKTYKNAFASLTLNYEYVWYGEFEIDESIFNAIQNKFKQFNRDV
ncbi:MAG: hypothetical protein ABI760_19560 [Ferruginibacter sp.]